jgi:hypothetical protein
MVALFFCQTLSLGEVPSVFSFDAVDSLQVLTAALPKAPTPLPCQEHSHLAADARSHEPRGRAEVQGIAVVRGCEEAECCSAAAVSEGRCHL